MDLLFCISHLLDLRAGWWSLFIITNAIRARQIYGVTAIKSGCVVVWKVTVRVEVASLK